MCIKDITNISLLLVRQGLLSTDLVGSVIIVIDMVIYALFAIVSMGEIYIALNSLIKIIMFNPLTFTKSGELKLIIRPILLTHLFVLPQMKTPIFIMAALAT